ncbi:MAG: hypothetical protein H7X92_13905 [Chitinophagales bacterium]|nr:hypothetical protein [Hyphomicrobiales bacterium]
MYRALIAILMTIASPTAAQMDFSGMSSSIAANNLMTSQWMTNEVINREIVPTIAGRGSSAPRGRQSGLSMAIRSALLPAGRGAAPAPASQRFGYARTGQVSQAVRRDLFERISRHDANAGKQVVEQFGEHDAFSIYSGIVAPFGLQRGDVADTMTAYTLLGWIIANGGADPSRRQVAAVRARIAGELAANPDLASPVNRQRLDEELMYLFVILHAGWQSASRSDARAYSDGVDTMFRQQFGGDLRRLALTDEGFRQR